MNHTDERAFEATNTPPHGAWANFAYSSTVGWRSPSRCAANRIVDPSVDAGRVADRCAYSLLDAVSRIPGMPTVE